MRTEIEIQKKLLSLRQKGAKSKNEERLQFAKIELLLWILRCDDCKDSPCTCDLPF